MPRVIDAIKFAEALDESIKRRKKNIEDLPDGLVLEIMKNFIITLEQLKLDVEKSSIHIP